MMKEMEEYAESWIFDIKKNMAKAKTLYNNYVDALYHIENILRKNNEYSERMCGYEEEYTVNDDNSNGWM